VRSPEGIAEDLVIGGSPESQTRQQRLAGLKSGLRTGVQVLQALDAGGPLTRAALKRNTVQAAADIFTKEKFVILREAENLFGSANVTPLVYKSGLSAEGGSPTWWRSRRTPAVHLGLAGAAAGWTCPGPLTYRGG
jgi:osmoprotectant transport system substrate-binding protein